MRRIVIFGAIIFVVILSMLVLSRYLTTGRIVVTSSNQGNTITITAISDNPSTSNGVVGKGKGSLAMSVNPGKYTVSVQSGAGAASQVVEVQSRQTTSITLDPPDPLPIEPVTDAIAQSVVANSSRLYYIDPTTENLFQIDAQNNIHSIDQSQRFNSVKWANSTYGVGQDDGGQMYEISDGAISAMKTLNSQIPLGLAGVVTYDVSPSKQLYLAFNKNVYLYTPTGSLQKIASTDQLPTLTATDSKVAINIRPSHGISGSNAKVTIAGQSGVLAQKNIQASDIEWSPSGKFLITTDDAASKIYDTSLNQVFTIPFSNISNPVWKDDDTLIYSINNQLWRYSPTSQKAELISSNPDNGAITGISFSDDKSYLYLTAEHGYNNPVIRRIGLNNQGVQGVVSKLQALLPISTYDYSMILTNFTHPTLFIQAAPTGSLNTYRQAATTKLQQSGIDINQVELRFLD